MVVSERGPQASRPKTLLGLTAPYDEEETIHNLKVGRTPMSKTMLDFWFLLSAFLSSMSESSTQTGRVSKTTIFQDDIRFSFADLVKVIAIDTRRAWLKKEPTLVQRIG